ncbi:inositol 5-phosphatase-like protein [Leishmania major strain Friedlin]|uniref:Inositol 5-phosphatase-like protein n=1 Tax=Leishmania major TaxID=5664 RepID=Q4Q381_LEIMA|nr:inositol 5-phosphatase-like protein [Leishmania major strain Friedlin]CAG9581963.1 inositol_5-phosphatase-like_protein [Leishmania major strain Friedlin]CAJ07831.1 inositol 5-phosphatase-like protein [Leishmania major strain Friedlin]|eukprot:XP_001686217.1 inositol 5-phosphatase-like protein [Leishmania major strain Friedlin]
MQGTNLPPEQRWKKEEAPRAPLWARAAVIIIEVIIWLVTFGTVKRVKALEVLFHYSPHWRKRDRAEASIKGALRTGMGAARRLARPLLRIETEFSTESRSCNSGGALTPLTATAYKETLKRRQQVNARIRSCLRDVPVDDLQAPFLVNACTWNVDQQAPPLYEDTFLSWLIGQELTDEVKRYQEHKQAVLAYGGSLSKPHYPTGPSTMRSRKASASAGSSEDARSPKRTTAEDFRLADQQRAAAILEREWQWIEAKFPDLFLISLQEVEMTGTALMRESTQRSWEWADAIIETLAAASDRTIDYKKVQVVQLVGLVLIVLIQAKHVDYVSHVRLSLTRTGALSVLGNKGSVAMRVTIYGKRFLFISAHFVAHKHNEKRRTSNYQAALKDICFDMPVWSDDESEVLQTFLSAKEVLNHSIEHSSVQGNSAWDRLFSFGHSAFRTSFTTAAETRVLDEHDYVFFLGDLNSRLHALPSPLIKESVERGEYDNLLCHDELRQLMVSGEAFDGFQEQWISFPPTYRYDRGTDVFDTSRKRRDPAWCDRVLFRVLENDTVTATSQEETSAETPESSGSFEPPLHNVQSSLLLPCDSLTSGVWMSLEELESKQLFPSAAALTRAASAGSSSVTSSDDLACERSLLHDVQNTADAPQNDFDSADKPFQCPPASLSCRAPTHAVWEQKRCAPTFCAARRPRGLLESSSSGEVLAMPTRFPMITNHIHPLEYTCVSSLRQSDHRPVRARFEVKVIAIEPALVSKVVKEVQQVIS